MVIVTGATSGIGYAVCKALVQSDYSVIGIGRSEENCINAQKSLKAVNENANVRFLYGDLMQQREVVRIGRRVAEMIEENKSDGLCALINNAGCVRSRFMTTQEGYEQQLALNYLAGFLLTHALMPQIKAANAAVIFTGSASHKMMKVHWGDMMYERRYRPLYAYKQSKLCNMLLAYKLREMGIRAYGVDPGLVNTNIGNKDTDGMVSLVWRFRKRHGVSPEESAKIYHSLCMNDYNGFYVGLGMKALKPSPEVNGKNAGRLYDLSLRLCGMEGGRGA